MPASKSRTSHTTPPRKKACEQCSRSKVRCDLKRATCIRCQQRGLRCRYVARPDDEISNIPTTDFTLDPVVPATGVGSVDYWPTGNVAQPLTPLTQTTFTPSNEVAANPGASSIPSPAFSGRLQEHTTRDARQTVPTTSAGAATGITGHVVDSFSSGFSDLVCTVDVDQIRNRWLNAFLPSLDQIPKNYPPSITAFIARTLKAYSSMLIRNGTLPPFLHPSQLYMAMPAVPLPLANCLSLVRMCDRVLPEGEAMVQSAIREEMNRTYDERHALNQVNLLAAFQAYLIYAMILYFHFEPQADGFLRQAVVSLQDLACEASSQGLVAVAELEKSRPEWETWVIAEAKRRTLYIMYLFDSVLSSHDNLPTFLAKELHGLPAPANRALWQASCRREWSQAYNSHMCDWVDGGLRIDELWPIPPEMGKEEIAERRRRVDHWLESVDEYGTMLSAVTICTHGG